MVHHSRYRWMVLAAFSLAAALSQALWLNFAPLISFIEQKYKVTEDQAGLLLLVFPLVYVLISIPTGKLIDKKGYRFSLGLGGLIMAFFSILRINPDSFQILLIAQIGIAIAQPFIINSISKLVLDWFDRDQEAIATGLGTMGMFLGMALGMMVTPLMNDELGFHMTMIIFATLSTVSCFISFIFIKNKKTYLISNASQVSGVSHVSSSSHISSSSSGLGFKTIIKDKNLVRIFLLAFMGLGFFNGLTTWLEPILAPRGISSVQAGVVGGMLIIGGVFGSAIIPALSDYWKQRKPLLILSVVMAALTLWPLCHTGNFNTLFILSSVQGFFFLPAFSLLLQMCSEQVGETLAGTATGILMLLGNAGGVAVILLMEAVKTDTAFTNGIYLLQIILVISVLLGLSLMETFPSNELKRG